MAGSDNVQEVRDRILRLAKEIETLATSNTPPDSFFGEFLSRIVAALGATAGGVWMRQGDQLRLVADQGLQSSNFLSHPDAAGTNQRLLREVLSSSQRITLSPDDVASDVKLPTQDLLLLAPLSCNGQTVGIVEVIHQPDTPQSARAGFMQFLEKMCGYAGQFLQRQTSLSQQTAVPSSAPQKSAQSIPELSKNFEQFVFDLHRALSIDDVAKTAATQGRKLIECDRLSIAVMQGNQAVVKAVSDNEIVDQRSGHIQRLANLATHVIAMKESLTFTGQEEDLPPQVEEPLKEFIADSKTKLVMIVPCFANDPLIQKEDRPGRRPREKTKKPIGGIIVEQFSDSRPSPGMNDHVQLVADHLGTALANSRAYQGIFLLAIWQGLGRVWGLLEGRTLVKTLLVLGVIVGTIMALSWVPFEYRVSCEGKLMPVEQRHVFAQSDGEVIKVNVPANKEVVANEIIIVLKNDDLTSQLAGLINTVDNKKNLLKLLQAQRDSSQGTSSRQDSAMLEGQMKQTQLEIESAIVNVAILRERMKIPKDEEIEKKDMKDIRLEIRAPITGVVPTFQLDQLLAKRPVRRGELLMTVMNPNGPWRLQLEVDESRMGHILRAQQDLGVEALPIEFVLATDPTKSFRGRIVRMSTRTNASTDATSSIIEVEVELNADKIATRQIGAQVRAKISCGESTLGYVLLGDVIEFFRKRFWL